MLHTFFKKDYIFIPLDWNGLFLVKHIVKKKFLSTLSINSISKLKSTIYAQIYAFDANTVEKQLADIWITYINSFVVVECRLKLEILEHENLAIKV
jgi:hypothetical protein